LNKDITNTFFFIHQLKQGQNSAIEGYLLFDFNPNKTDLIVIRSKKKLEQAILMTNIVLQCHWRTL